MGHGARPAHAIERTACPHKQQRRGTPDYPHYLQAVPVHSTLPGTLVGHVWGWAGCACSGHLQFCGTRGTRHPGCRIFCYLQQRVPLPLYRALCGPPAPPAARHSSLLHSPPPVSCASPCHQRRLHFHTAVRFAALLHHRLPLPIFYCHALDGRWDDTLLLIFPVPFHLCQHGTADRSATSIYLHPSTILSKISPAGNQNDFTRALTLHAIATRFIAAQPCSSRACLPLARTLSRSIGAPAPRGGSSASFIMLFSCCTLLAPAARTAERPSVTLHASLVTSSRHCLSPALWREGLHGLTIPPGPTGVTRGRTSGRAFPPPPPHLTAAHFARCTHNMRSFFATHPSAAGRFLPPARAP